jgi:hypothetical protein
VTASTEPQPAGKIDYAHEVLDLFAFDNTGDIWWRTDGEYAPVTFFVLCSDLFWWGTSDLERITPDNLPALKQAFVDAGEAADDGAGMAAYLFCARQRGMRPQGAQYKHIDKELWPLFDACGPARVVELGNPKHHPSEVS